MTLYEPALDAIEVRHLHYFAVVAEENSLRRAAERLFMAQPPLSRQIKQLEERLGVTLFIRHSKGLTLTPEGAGVLEIIRPLLQMRDATFARLREEVRPQDRALRLGFTTAFEQGIFAKLEARLPARQGKGLRVTRDTSLKLVREIRKGRLDAALVALPLDAPGLVLQELPYAEPMVAAIPADWPEAGPHAGKTSTQKPSLRDFNGRQLFWFRREANPAFFDLHKRRFALAGFTPVFTEEPAEYDVLLARISFGEGMGLLAASFATIRRQGVVFIHLREERELFMPLGIVSLPDKAQAARAVADFFQTSD